MRWGTTIIMGWAFVFSQRREADRMPHPPIEPHSQIFPGAVPSMKSETRWGQEVMAISSGIGCARGVGAAVSSESGAVGTSIRQDGKTYGFPARQEHAIGTSIRCGPVCHRHDPRTVFGGFPGIAGTGSCVCHGPPGIPFVIISFSCRSKVSQSDAMAGKTNFSKCRRMGSPPGGNTFTEKPSRSIWTIRPADRLSPHAAPGIFPGNLPEGTAFAVRAEKVLGGNAGVLRKQQQIRDGGQAAAGFPMSPARRGHAHFARDVGDFLAFRFPPLPELEADAG